MKEGTTKTGFHFSLEDDVMDNMELVEELAKAQENDPVAVSRIVTMVFGQEQKKALYAHLRNPENGNVPISAVSEAIAEIFRGSGNLKN